jgi:hypothetical protein
MLVKNRSNVKKKKNTNGLNRFIGSVDFNRKYICKKAIIRKSIKVSALSQFNNSLSDMNPKSLSTGNLPVCTNSWYHCE